MNSATKREEDIFVAPPSVRYSYLIWMAIIAVAVILGYELYGQPSALTLLKIEFFPDIFFSSLKKVREFQGGYWNAIRNCAIFIFSASLVLSLGRFLLVRILDLDEDTRHSLPWMHLLASFGLGLAVLSTFFAVLGSFGFLKTWIGTLLLFFGFCLLYFNLKEVAGSFKNFFAVSRSERKYKFLIRLAQGALILWIGVVASSCLAPPNDYDVLQYHWANPTHYLNEGNIKPNPYNFFSYLPQNAEMIYLWQFMLHADVSAKIFNFSLWLFLILGIIAYARENQDGWSGWFGGLLFAFIPLGFWEASDPKNDLTLAYYNFFAIFFLACSLQKTQDSFEEQKNARRQLFLSALFMGAALGTKHTSLHQFLISIGVLVCALKFYQKLSLKGIFSNVAVYVLGSTIFSFLWYLRNLMTSGNPLYPFYSGFIPTHFQSDWHYQSAEYMVWDGKKFLNWEGFRDQAKILLEMGGRSNLQGWGNALIIFLAPLLITIRSVRFDRLKWILLISGLGFLLGQLVTWNWRMFLGQLALICCLIAILVGRVTQEKKIQRVFLTFIAILALMNPTRRWAYENLKAGLYVLAHGLEATQVSYNLGGEPVNISDLEVIKRYVHKNIPQGSRLLFVGERRAAGFRRRFYAASGYDRTQFEDWISKVDDARGFYAILKEKGVTHLIMNPSGIVSLDPKKGELYSEFLSRYSEALIRTANGNLLVYKII